MNCKFELKEKGVSKYGQWIQQQRSSYITNRVKRSYSVFCQYMRSSKVYTKKLEMLSSHKNGCKN